MRPDSNFDAYAKRGAVTHSWWWCVRACVFWSKGLTLRAHFSLSGLSESRVGDSRLIHKICDLAGWSDCSDRKDFNAVYHTQSLVLSINQQ